MIGTIGHLALLAAVAASAWAIVASLIGAACDRQDLARGATRGLQAAALLLSTALGALGWALLSGDYSLEYVARATSRSMSWPYRLGSLWSGMEGSLLLWSWLLAVGLTRGVAQLRRTAKPAAQLVNCNPRPLRAGNRGRFGLRMIENRLSDLTSDVHDLPS